MAKIRNRCEICGRGATVAHQVSHAHNVSKRRKFPNIHRVHAVIHGAPRYIHACTRCLRSGRVQKAS